ncbi:hypothetical protein GGF37_003799 [Kickxella alabastrina]|nr:hypothetical protein GGF37_003799 [Kickxella alabastrina]
MWEGMEYKWHSKHGSISVLALLGAPTTATPSKLKGALKEFGIFTHVDSLLCAGYATGNWIGFFHPKAGAKPHPKTIRLNYTTQDIRIVDFSDTIECAHCGHVDVSPCSCTQATGHCVKRAAAEPKANAQHPAQSTTTADASTMEADIPSPIVSGQQATQPLSTAAPCAHEQSVQRTAPTPNNSDEIVIDMSDEYDSDSAMSQSASTNTPSHHTAASRNHVAATSAAVKSRKACPTEPLALSGTQHHYTTQSAAQAATPTPLTAAAPEDANMMDVNEVPATHY